MSKRFFFPPFQLGDAAGASGTLGKAQPPNTANNIGGIFGGRRVILGRKENIKVSGKSWAWGKNGSSEKFGLKSS